MINLIVADNPLDPTNRQVRALRNVSRASVEDLIAIGEVDMSRPTIAIVDGRPILREHWQEEMELNHIIFFTLPEGGLVASVFSVVAGIFFGGSSLATGLLLGVGAVAGSLIGGLFSPPKPRVDVDNQKSSPTYNLTRVGNYARLGEPIPVLYGRHIVYPDYVFQPYRENQDDNSALTLDQQFFFALLCVTQGECSFVEDDILMDDTPVTRFPEVTWSKINPGGALPAWLDEATVTASEVSNLELPGGSGGSGAYKGPFAVNPPRTTIDEIEVDVDFPLGIYNVDTGASTSVQIEWWARKINDDGTVADLKPGTPAFWRKVIDQTISSDNATPIRETFSSGTLTDGAGRYEMRARRMTAGDRSNIIDRAIWRGLKGKNVVGRPSTFADMTCLAVQIQATGAVNDQTLRRINVIAQRKLPTWTSGGGWAAVSDTSNPAWAFADVLRNTVYGMGVADAKIDLDGIKALADIWATRGDEFNGVFDTKVTAWEALTRIARAGRASPVIQAGCVRLIRDVLQNTPLAMFTPRNIVKGTLRVEYDMPHEETHDGVRVEYMDERSWKREEIDVDPDGGTSPSNPAVIDLFGVTNVTQATNEALYLARNNKFRRKRVQWETEMEGFPLTMGDLVIVQHDCPQWGESSGDVVGLVGDVIQISELFEFAGGTDYVVWFAKLNGDLVGPLDLLKNQDHALELDGTYTLVDDGEKIAVTGDATIDLHYASEYERTRYMIGVKDQIEERVLVQKVTPRGLHRVQIQGIKEEDAVHGISNSASELLIALVDQGATPSVAEQTALDTFMAAAEASTYWGKLDYFYLPVFGVDNANWMNWKNFTEIASWVISGGTDFDRVNYGGGVHCPNGANDLYLDPSLGDAFDIGVGTLAGGIGGVVSEISGTTLAGALAGQSATTNRWRMFLSGTEMCYDHHTNTTGRVQSSTSDYLGFIKAAAFATAGGNNRAFWHYDKAIYDVTGTIETDDTDGGAGASGTTPNNGQDFPLLSRHDGTSYADFFKGDIHALFFHGASDWTEADSQALAEDLYALIPAFFTGAEVLP